MNKQRRLSIEDVRLKLEIIINTIDSLKDEEQEAFDNLPDSLQKCR